MFYILGAILFILLFLWFHRVWCIMRERRHTVKVAAEQLAFCLNKSLELQGDPKNDGVLIRSKHIYNQAIRIYQIALENPFNWLPATLMGFRPINEYEDTIQR